MITDNLESLGFSSIEAKVFSAVLENNPCHIIRIFKATGKHRQVIYNALDTLEKKGLITVSKKHGKNLYAVGNPDRLLVDLKQKEVLAQNVVRQIEQFIAPEKEQVETFTGDNAYVKAMQSFRLHAESEKEFIVFGGQNKEWFSRTRDIFDHHVSELRRMKRIGVDILVLYFLDEWEDSKRFFTQYIKDPYTVKILNSLPTLPHPVWLTGDHVYILTPVNNPIIVHIKSKELSEKYHQHFWRSWESAQLAT